MNTTELANQRLDDAGFANNQLADYEFPATSFAPHGSARVPYKIFGDRQAPHVVLEAAPYATSIESPHYELRLLAQQEALGDEYCVVAVEAYSPRQPLDRTERKKVQKGDFSSLAMRVLRVGEALQLKDHQVVWAYGYSAGADIGVQLAHDTATNPNRGVIPLSRVGAIECARVLGRSALQVIQAMGTSGKELFDNIQRSDCPALLEAWHIDPKTSPDKMRRTFNSRGIVGIGRYWLRNTPMNCAITRGFGTDASLQQLKVVLNQPNADLQVFTGRQSRSTVCPQEFFDALPESNRLTLLYEDGDHSADDDIRRSAGRILHFASTEM